MKHSHTPMRLRHVYVPLLLLVVFAYAMKYFMDYDVGKSSIWKSIVPGT